MRHNLHFTSEFIPEAPIPESAPAFTEELHTLSARVAQGTYEFPEASLLLPLDAAMLNEVNDCVKRFATTKLKYVIVIGIGGSNLGTQAVYDALVAGEGAKKSSHPQLIFADTIATPLLNDIVALCTSEIASAPEILINLISKSGSTTESIANFEILYAALLPRFPQILERIVVTTDKDSPLWIRATQLGIGLLPIPHMVGGRFSVFSPVGLFPLALAGVNVGELRAGAEDFLKTCVGNRGEKNLAQESAEAIYQAHGAGVNILNFFFFNPEFESLGKWARQLYAESLGKEKDLKGNIIHTGITPVVSIGSTDLHSMAQLYLGGPRNMMTIFLHVKEKESAAFTITPDALFIDLLPQLEGKSPEVIMDAIYSGVKEAYRAHQLPFGEIDFSERSPYMLGVFLEWQMLTVMYLGRMFNVNTFDQPNVEDYKKITRVILEK